MRIHRLFIVISILSSLSSALGAPLTMSDAEILKRIYKGPQVTPGFYSEPEPKSPKESIEVCWITLPKDQHGLKKEASAQTVEEAFKLTQQWVKLNGVPVERAQISARSTTDRFFQFVTHDRNDTYDYYTYYRVWRSDYFQSSGEKFDSYLPSSNVQLGVLKIRPDLDNVRRFVEFLWWKNCHNTKGFVVLTPVAMRQEGALIKATMTGGEMEFGDYNVTDRAHVKSWIVSVDTRTGLVTSSYSTIKIIDGNKNPPSMLDLSH